MEKQKKKQSQRRLLYWNHREYGSKRESAEKWTWNNNNGNLTDIMYELTVAMMVVLMCLIDNWIEKCELASETVAAGAVEESIERKIWMRNLCDFY